MTTTFNLATDSVRDDNGDVNVNATMDKFHSQLLVHLANRETELTTISNAVNEVFSRHPGARMNMPCLVNAALVILNVQPENYKVLAKRVHEFVQENASSKREDGKPFGIQKGRTVGGCCRWADVPVETSDKKAKK